MCEIFTNIDHCASCKHNCVCKYSDNDKAIREIIQKTVDHSCIDMRQFSISVTCKHYDPMHTVTMRGDEVTNNPIINQKGLNIHDNKDFTECSFSTHENRSMQRFGYEIDDKQK